MIAVHSLASPSLVALPLTAPSVAVSPWIAAPADAVPWHVTAIWLAAGLLPLGMALVSGFVGLAPDRVATGARRWLTRLAPLGVMPAAILALLGPDAARLEVPWLLFGAVLELDELGAPLLLMASLLYGVALLAIPRSGTERAPALSALLLLCFAGNAGVFVAGDAVSFYFFFTLMSFVGYALVIHSRAASARRAGRVYLVFTVLGEGAILAALMLIVDAGGSLLADAPAAVADSPARDVIILLLLVGFGVKAGTVPLHVWLPLAHPAAPTPASAVLSGSMVTAGLLGWLRFLPLGEIASPGWGTAFIVVALLGAFLAIPAGVLQADTKVILAYSSISQLGFMAALVGAALLDPALAPACIAAAVLYAVHHGIAKGALFLGIPLWGAYRRTWLRVAVLAGLAVAALAIAGAPLTSGYLAKYAGKTAVGATVFGDIGGVVAIELAVILPFVGAGSTVLLARAGWVLLRSRSESTASPALLPAWLALVVAGAALVATLAPTLSVEVPAVVSAAIWWDQLWPLLLGVALAALALALAARDIGPSWAAHPDGTAVPPGDVVVVEEAALRRVSRVAAQAGSRLGDAADGIRTALRSVPSPLPLAARAQESLDRWRASGIVVLALLAALLLLAAALGAGADSAGSSVGLSGEGGEK